MGVSPAAPSRMRTCFTSFRKNAELRMTMLGLGPCTIEAVKAYKPKQQLRSDRYYPPYEADKARLVLRNGGPSLDGLG